MRRDGLQAFPFVRGGDEAQQAVAHGLRIDLLDIHAQRQTP